MGSSVIVRPNWGLLSRRSRQLVQDLLGGTWTDSPILQAE